MNAFEFIVEFHEKYADKAAKNPRICGYYTALIKHFRDRFEVLGSPTKEQKEIVEMMVMECSLLKKLAINNAISEKVSEE